MANDRVYIVERGERWEGTWIACVSSFRHVALKAYNKAVSEASRVDFVSLTVYNPLTGGTIAKGSKHFRGWD